MVTKTRAQDEDPKGKGVDTGEMEPPWLARFQEEFDRKLARFQEEFDRKLSRFQEANDQRFLQMEARFQEANDQRFSRLEAMAADFLCRSRKGKKEDPEDQICNDEELAEIEAETKSSGIEDRAVENEANATMILAIDKEEPIPQLQVHVSKLEPSLRFRNASPDVCEDFKSIVGFDGLFDHVKARNELVTKSTSMTNNQVAPQLFDEIPLRKGILPKEHKKRFQKCWRFKFKDTAQPRGLIQEKLCVHEVNETMNQLMLPMHLGRHILYQQLERNLCEYKDQILQLSNHDLETQMLPCLQRFSTVRMGLHAVFCLQELKPIWWVGYTEAVGATSTKQALSYWSVANHVKRDAQESFGYNLIVAYMENKKTWTKLRVRKHDNLIWKEDVSDESRSRPSRCIVKLGDATFTCKNLLEKSYDKNLDTVAWRNRPGRSEISNEEDQGNLQSRIGFSFSRGKHSTFILLSESKVWTEKQIPTLQILKQVNKSQYRWTQEPKLAGRKRNYDLFIRLHNKVKQQRCPKSWMFKFKTDSKSARTNHILLQEKKPSFVAIEEALFMETDADYVQQDEFDDERSQIKHKWRFKVLPLILEWELYSDGLVLVTNYAQQLDISRLMILMNVGWFTNLRSQLLFTALKWSVQIVVSLQIIWFSSLQTLRSRFL